MSADTMTTYQRSQDHFDAVMAAVPADRWDAPSACALWTIRDVAGHVIWGQDQMRHWATAEDYPHPEGAPGAPHPGDLARDDPVATWRTARAACSGTLTDDALTRTVTINGLGETPLASIVTLLVTDHLAHAWDISHALGLDVGIDADLIVGSLAWARANVVRMPGFFGPELALPPDADEQTRWLAYLGRAAWQPVAA